MERSWKTLVDAGVPWGAIRPKASRVDLAAVRGAVERISSSVESLDPRQQDALQAWLRAFSRHWPSGFRRVLGSAGTRLLRQLEVRPIDPNRYLKLKRIAVEALAELV